MKIAVGCLLLLTTLVQCQFRAGYNCGQSSTLRMREPFMGSLRGLGRIVGGEQTADCSVIPWQVQIQAGSMLCGGSIISRNHILTAAHCFIDINFNARFVKVIVAEHNVFVPTPEKRVILVNNLKVHEGFDRVRKVNDIAILTLAETLDYNRCVAPICLDRYFVPNGEYCIGAGWGSTSFEGEASPILKMTKLETFKGSECKRTFNILVDDYLIDQTTQICAGHPPYQNNNKKEDVCQGDSGGPLMCWSNGRYVQAGIHSHGRGCGEPNWPSIETNVPAFYDWIDRNMNEQ